MIHSSTHHNKTSSHYKQHGLTLLELTIVLLILMALAGLVLPTFTEVPRYAQCTATKSTMKAIRDALLGNIDGPGYVADIGFFPNSLGGLLGSTPPFYCSDRSITTSPACTTALETWQLENTFNPVTSSGWNGSYMQESISLSTALTGNFALTTHVDPPINIADAIIPDSFSNSTGTPNPIILQNPKDTPAVLPAISTDCTVDVPGAIDINDCIRLVSAGDNGVLDTALSDAAGATRGDDIILYLRVSDPSTAADATGCKLSDE